MARNLLAIVTAAALEMGLNAPAAVVGSGDAQTQQLMALLNRAGTELAAIEGGWQSLRGEQLIPVVAGADTYPFPSDFAYYVPETQWNRSAHYRIGGPMSAIDWQAIKSGLFPSGVYSRYRIFGNSIVFDPVPSAAATVAIEYISSNWVQSAAGVSQPYFMLDTDTPRIPDDLLLLGLKWRFLAATGFDYTQEQATYELALSRLHPRDTVLENIQMSTRSNFNDGLNTGLLPAGSWPGR